MKKTTIALIACSVLMVPAVVFAQGGNMGEGNEQQDRIQAPETHTGTETPEENEIQNQERITTENQGEDTQVQVENKEQEISGEGQGEEHMSAVAEQVQQLLQVRTSGGIGDQVRQIAQEQNQAQMQIQTQLSRLDAKGKFVRFLTGTDYGAVKNLRQQLEQNLVRIQQLQQLQTQLVNQEDSAVIEETISALEQENTSLQSRITAEEQTRSLFGWLFRMLSV